MTNNLKENIALILSYNNLSQSDLAKIIGVTQKVVSNWVTGVSNIPLDKLLILAEKFNYSLDAMVYEHIGYNSQQLDQFVKENHPELYHNEKKQSISGGNIELDHLKELMKAKDDTIASLKMTNELLKNQLDDLKREIPKRLPRDNGSNNKAS
tara:strand:+ start:498 stop:956 length:459 start_codon:yes stop_codon:yes gene_type:complete